MGYAASQNAALDSFFVYKTVNAGSSWTLTYSGTASTFCETRSIFFTDAMTGSMAIYGGGIYKTTDGGYTWVSKLSSGTGLGIGADLPVCIHFPSSTVGYSITDDSVYKSTDAGETWLPIAAPPSSIIYTSIFFTDVDTGYAGGGNGISTGGIQKTVNGGTIWTLSNTNPNTFQSIHFPNSSTGYACGQAGIIYKYSPGTGISDLKNEYEISVFPNPADNFCTYEITLGAGKIGSINLCDALGRVLQTHTINNQKNQVVLDLSDCKSGFYFVHGIINRAVVDSRKLIVK